MIKKSVSVYDRDKSGIYLHPSAFTEMGLLIAIQPFEHVTADEKKDLIWEKIVALLEKSGGRIPHPTNWNQLDPMIKKARCTSWRAFAKNAKMCTVDISNDKYVFTPYEWDGKGFAGVKSKSKTLYINSNKSELIEALFDCLTKSKHD